jgi:hypothetical protein
MSRRSIRERVRSWPATLEQVPREDWPEWPWGGGEPLEVWRSRTWIVQVFAARYGTGADVRISVRRRDGTPDISWRDLQGIKAQIGRGSEFAVEAFPADADVVDVANMRHLWVIPRPPWAWKASGS